MGKIFRGGAIMAAQGANTGILPNYSIHLEDTRIANYSDIEPKIFRIPSKTIEKLFADAKKQGKEVALAITNIQDPSKVKARWIVFDEQAAKANEDYYVFAEKYYDDGGTPIVAGLRIRPFKAMRYNYVCAIIGKDTINGAEVHFVFFHPARLRYEVEYERGGAGPTGAGGGVELP